MLILDKIKKIPKKLSTLLKRIKSKVKREYLKLINKKQIETLITEINNQNKPTIIFLNVVDWNIPLFQRPQHIARYMSKEEYNYLFFTGNIYDDILTYEKKDDNLYVVNASYFKDIVKSIQVTDKYIHLYSTDMGTTNKQINQYVKYGYKILYEYIDEISEQLYGSKIPKNALEKHRRLIEDKSIYFVCTARKLYNEVVSIRGTERVELITNGVEYEHFSGSNNECNIQALVDKQKPIIGYFGAFASWFDYELIEELAKTRPQYEILLIGWDYDGSIKKSRLNEYENINIIGPIGYEELPKYARAFSVSTIPFKINDITESTSPIKLFEYMALGKPIVTTNMPECRLYKSVLIGTSIEKFIEQIDYSITLHKNQKYMKILREEALDNTWEHKARSIINLLGE